MVRYHTRLDVYTCCACFAENMMIMYQQFPPIRYVNPYGLVLVLCYCREVAFCNPQIVHGLPPPPFSHPDFLKCWCARHETALNGCASGDQTWGFSGRCSVAEDA